MRLADSILFLAHNGIFCGSKLICATSHTAVYLCIQSFNRIGANNLWFLHRLFYSKTASFRRACPQRKRVWMCLSIRLKMYYGKTFRLCIISFMISGHSMQPLFNTAIEIAIGMSWHGMALAITFYGYTKHSNWVFALRFLVYTFPKLKLVAGQFSYVCSHAYQAKLFPLFFLLISKDCHNSECRRCWKINDCSTFLLLLDIRRMQTWRWWQNEENENKLKEQRRKKESRKSRGRKS